MDGMEDLDPNRRCICGKVYQTLQSLERHMRQKCLVAFSEDCKAILRILSCLEPRPVPADLFYRALSPFKVWNENGNESLGRLAKLLPIFSDSQRLDHAIRIICAIPAVEATDSAVSPDTESYPWWADCDLILDAQCRAFIHNELHRLPGQLLSWQLETIRVILQAFPHRDLDNKFIEKGRAFSPFVLPALQKLEEGSFQSFPQHPSLHLDEIERGIDVCIAVTLFGNFPAKEAALSMAQSLLRWIPSSPRVPLGQTIQVQVRQMALCLIHGQPVPTSFPLGDRQKGKRNALLAEFLLIQAQRCAEQGYISHSWQFLDQWMPAYAAQPSVLETIISFRIDLMKGKVCRYQGAFEKSRIYLEPLASQYPAPQAQFLSKLHLISVYGELSLWDKGKDLLSRWDMGKDLLSRLEGRDSPTNIAATADPQKRLLQLTWAEFHLARGLDGSDNDLLTAKELFVGLIKGYEEIIPSRQATKRNFARVCLGLAIISHVQRRGKPDFALFRALNDWRLAYDACIKSSTVDNGPGFPALVCLLSITELKASLNDTTWKADLRCARELWAGLRQRELDQRFFFSNIGTRWANLVCDWLGAVEEPLVLPRWCAT
ncbi:hypothetical protein QBC43DRAFT_320485 [Cladorrhinum sp. PSN259]|nr:hypothetical protein QBC43DRAFT_320485 [Cladorrhinum sp. PSN259]